MAPILKVDLWLKSGHGSPSPYVHSPDSKKEKGEKNIRFPSWVHLFCLGVFLEARDNNKKMPTLYKEEYSQMVTSARVPGK